MVAPKFLAPPLLHARCGAWLWKYIIPKTLFFTCHAKDFLKPFWVQLLHPKSCLFLKNVKSFYFLHIFLDFWSVSFWLFVRPPLLSFCRIGQACLLCSVWTKKSWDKFLSLTAFVQKKLHHMVKAFTNIGRCKLLFMKIAEFSITLFNLPLTFEISDGL